ncbi:MAG: hypothetical protein Q4E62_02210 [Sutterellaceae bacterium]|nr:hypothetical protein [Sutterellaceae bacterium]
METPVQNGAANRLGVKEKLRVRVRSAVAGAALLGVVFAAQHFLFDQYSYVADINLVNPVAHARELLDQGKYSEAQDYISFFKSLPNVTAKETEAFKPLDTELEAVRDSWQYQAKELGKGFFLGESEEFYGQVAGLVSELTSVGDVRDLWQSGVNYVHGDDVDELTAGLSAVGLALTIMSVGPQAGVTIPAKTGIAVVKTANKARKLSKSLQESIKVLTTRMVKNKSIEPVMKDLIEPMAQLGMYSKRSGLTNTLEVLGKSDSVGEIPRVIKVADRFGDKAGGVFRYGGADVVKVAEKEGVQAVLRTSKYGPEAVSKLKAVRGEKLLNDIRRWGQIVASPMLKMLDLALFVLKAILGFIETVLGFLVLRAVKALIW